jgi:hypothetical protein
MSLLQFTKIKNSFISNKMMIFSQQQNCQKKRLAGAG